MNKSTYVLGTSLSHNGSAALLKDGVICAAIEKERITRIKQDGYNDTAAINYCLEKEGISLTDISLIVQNSPIRFFESGYEYFGGYRLIKNDSKIPVVTISHHLAHAYSAIGTSKFEDCAVLIIDGSGNAIEDCIDLNGNVKVLNNDIDAITPYINRENNSYYHYTDGKCKPVCKEFSSIRFPNEDIISPFTNNSIGDVFGAASAYCFRDMHDAGKLMGLAPYGDPTKYLERIFQFENGMVLVDHDLLAKFKTPARSHSEFKKNFQYYADIASWIQREAERAVLYVINTRHEMCPSDRLAYSGGVALNAVINAKIRDNTPFKQLYIQPAAGDNGISVGCAYYGWLEIMKMAKPLHSGSTCYGKIYSSQDVLRAIEKVAPIDDPRIVKNKIDTFFDGINDLNNSIDLDGDDFLVQFDIKNAGIYQVKVSDKTIESKNGILGRPTSIVALRNNDMYQGIQNFNHFNTLVSTNKVEVSDFEEVETLMRLIGPVKNGNNECQSLVTEQSKLIHFNGDGFISEAARLLASGKVIGWFQDESEFGPRALGRRSILADPRTPGIRDYINAKIKLREDFRPFAPSVIREDVSEYFDTDDELPYMIVVRNIKEEYRNIITNVVHEDGTCRIQTVTSDWNSKYYSLLNQFKLLSGISVLLNTSFNGKAMPIVETPEDAIDFFYNSKLDYLVIQDIILKK